MQNKIMIATKTKYNTRTFKRYCSHNNCGVRYTLTTKYIGLPQYHN